MGIISNIIGLTFAQKMIFLLALAIFSPGIFFFGMVIIYFGFGIITFILQWVILVIEIPINTITILFATITTIISNPFNPANWGWSTIWAIDFNFDGKYTSLVTWSININFPSTSNLKYYSWFYYFGDIIPPDTYPTFNPKYLILPYYMRWI